MGIGATYLKHPHGHMRKSRSLGRKINPECFAREQRGLQLLQTSTWVIDRDSMESLPRVTQVSIRFWTAKQSAGSSGSDVRPGEKPLWEGLSWILVVETMPWSMSSARQLETALFVLVSRQSCVPLSLSWTLRCLLLQPAQWTRYSILGPSFSSAYGVALGHRFCPD